jgi:transcriptional regulator with XRE-family HTH domain
MTGHELKARRKALHLTQQELASLAGVTISTISTMESGKTEPHRGTIRLLELALASAEQQSADKASS